MGSYEAAAEGGSRCPRRVDSSSPRPASTNFPVWQTKSNQPIDGIMQTVDPSSVPSTDDPILVSIVDRLIAIYHPERIYLFGSAARGEAGPDSDYDIMIVVSDATPLGMQDTGPAYRALWRLGAAVDLLVWTRAQFDSRLHLRASLPSTVQREGKLLYAA
jgi:uncharacterized protein